MQKVYITGLGFITSIGNEYAEVRQSLIDLRSGIEKYAPFDREDVPVKLAGTIKEFDILSEDAEDWEYPSRYRPGRALLRSLSPHGLYAYCAVEQALGCVGWESDLISNVKTGLYTASAGSMSQLHYHLNYMHEKGVARLSPKAVVCSIPGTLNFSLVSHYKIKGNSCGFVSACASSGHALGMAHDDIALGRQDRMIVVGAEDGDFNTLLPFAGMRAMSDEPDPEKSSIPFDVNRSGFIGTGGAVAMTLESEESLKTRGAKPIVEFLGWGQSSDGYSAVLPEPEGEGVARSMESALESAGITSEDVDYINAHATATPQGDPAELKAIKKVFGEKSSVAISATKALTGHALSASSILEAGISAMALNEGFCPGTAKLRELDPEGEGLNILRETEFSNPQIALSNSSGFGGANATLILKKAEVE